VFQAELFQEGTCQRSTYVHRLKNKFKLYGISDDKQALILTDAIGARHYERLRDRRRRPKRSSAGRGL